MTAQLWAASLPAMPPAALKAKEKLIVVMPAYNAARTLRKTYEDLPLDVVDEIILTDDASTDNTVEVARQLGLTVLQHEKNMGYGANQKTCFTAALAKGADIIALIHPDYQYDPRILNAAVEFIRLGICDIILGSRIRNRRDTLARGMPGYKYWANRFLTRVENFFLGQKLSDLHTGFRVYKSSVLKQIDFMQNSDNFVFDSQLVMQAVYKKLIIGEVPVPARYQADSSSIGFFKSTVYGIQTLQALLQFILQKSHLARFKLFR